MIPTGLHGDAAPPHDGARLITDLRLEITPLDLIVQWQRCSMTADFLAQYLAWHFIDRANAQQTLSTGLNELIENIAKFSANKRDPATLSVAHYGEHLRITTVNRARGARAAALASRLDRLASTDPEELFLEQLEHTASNDRAASGLGLITIKKDYGALMWAEVLTIDGEADLYEVRFTVELDVNRVEQG